MKCSVFGVQSLVSALLGLFLVAWPANTVRAHEHWIDVDDFRPATPTNVTINICSGHYFPRSSFALQDKVLQDVELFAADGTTTSVQTTVLGKQRTGSVRLESEGVSLLRFTLKRPRAKAPSYEGKTILVTENGPDQIARYAVGHGLELLPLQPVTGMRPGDALPLVLLLDRQRVAGSLEASVEGGKSSFLKTEVDKPAMLRLAKPGRYLVTAHAKGRGCSLIFRIAKPGKEAL